MIRTVFPTPIRNYATIALSAYRSVQGPVLREYHDGRVVIDTGHGISSDYCEHLFTRFSRGAEGINSAERGIGLGLAIARELVERQGGTIWLEQTSSGGSTFSFTLPCMQLAPVPRSSSIATAA